MKIFLTVLIVLAGIAVLLFVGCLAAMWFIFIAPPKLDREDPKPDPLMGEDLPAFIRACTAAAERVKAEYPHERVSVKTDDGLTLYGISMGAATVMQASGLPLPESVVGIVEDCGLTSAYEEFRHMLKSMAHLPGFPLLNILGWQCKRFLKLDIKANDSRKCDAATKLPMLFLYGDADAFVPAAMAKECCAACAGDKRLVVFEGAAHAQSHFRHPEQYEREFFAFVEHVTSSASC